MIRIYLRIIAIITCFAMIVASSVAAFYLTSQGSSGTGFYHFISILTGFVMGYQIAAVVDELKDRKKRKNP